MSRKHAASPEGATYLEDLSGLKLSWVKTQDQLNVAEAENIAAAMRKHLKPSHSFLERCISGNYFKKLHQDMFGMVWTWAGQWRKAATNIGVLPHQISLQIHELCEDVRFWHKENSTLSITERAAHLHHRLVSIHPFANGNGRHARLMADIYLLNFSGALPRWPIDLHKVKNQYRGEYLKALKLADQGDYTPLLKFMRDLS